MVATHDTWLRQGVMATVALINQAGALPDQAGNPAEQAKVGQVVPAGEDEKAGEESQAGPKAIFLRALGQRTPPQGFGEVE